MSGDDGYRPVPAWRRLLGWNGVGALLVVAAVTVSLLQVMAVRRDFYSDGKVIVRIAHWQLEAGYRDALQHVIDDYNRLMEERHRRGAIPRPVQVVQVPVTEKVYGQLINTNLLARSAPDLIEMGMAKKVEGTQKAQFFIALDQAVRQPNPYNDAAALAAAGVDRALADALAALPWRDTILDGMRCGFDRDLQGFYGVPVNFANSGRLSYNKDLLRAATGSEEPPRTLAQLLDICAKVTAYGAARGERITPIAGTRYTQTFFSLYYLPFLAQYRDRLDLDRDGQVSGAEGWGAFGSGTFSLGDRPFLDLAAAVTAIARQFPPGFLALERDSATYLFIQGKAAMHITGSWDAGTLFSLSAGRFRMGTVEFPLPAAGEPWGDPAKHPASEIASVSGATFGVYKFGHTEEAVDFLRYLTSHAQNQRFNREADWIPVVLGTSPDARMAAYAPRLDGVQQGTAWAPDDGMGRQVASIYLGQMLALIGGETDAAGLQARVLDAYRNPAIGETAIWASTYDATKVNLRSLERTMVIQQAVAALGSGDAAETEDRYRTLLANQVVASNGENLRLVWRRTIGARTGRPFPEPER